MHSYLLKAEKDKRSTRQQVLNRISLYLSRRYQFRKKQRFFQVLVDIVTEKVKNKVLFNILDEFLIVNQGKKSFN